MKMTPWHYKHFSEAITAIDSPELRAAYKAEGLSLKRYQWDVTYKAGLTAYICETLYPYLNDDHIQTALNKIIKSI
jgi:hypothetical protein